MKALDSYDHRAKSAERALREQVLGAEPDKLVQELVPVIRRRARRVLSRHRSLASSDADDLAQDAIVWLLENDLRVLKTWRPDGGMSLRNFVGMICERRMRSQLRVVTRVVRDDRADHDQMRAKESDPEERALRRGVARALVRSLEAQLSELGVAMFRLLFVEQRSVSEVAHELATTVDAVYRWRSRIKQHVERLQVDDCLSDVRKRIPIPRRA